MSSKENDLKSILIKDGVTKIDVGNYQNATTTLISDIQDKLGLSNSWATRIAYNKNFGGVLIQQLPGQGNRLHYHPDVSECWYIIKGTWKWFIDREGEKIVKEGSFVNVKPNTFHQITCVGDEPGLRLAITVPDVMHVYK